MTAQKCAGGLKKKMDLRSGSQRHRHFVGFFNVPVQAPTRYHPFYGYSEKPPHLVAFKDTQGDTEDTFSIKHPAPFRVPTGNKVHPPPVDS